MQLEDTECGAASLGAILAFYDCWKSLEQLREAVDVSRDGSNLEDIAIAARSYGLKVTGWKAEISKLKDLPKPMILHWGFNHFLVLEKIVNGRYYLNDPAHGYRVVEADVFNRDYTGIALVLEPGPDFQTSGARPSILKWLWYWLREYRPQLIRTVLFGLFLAISSLMLPILLTIFIDRVLIGGELTQGAILVAAVFASGLLTYLLTWLQLRSLREIIIRLSISQSDRFLDCLLRLPVRFFAHRFAGDLVMRLRSINLLADIGAGQLVRMAVDILMSLAFLIVMIAFDLLLSAVIAGLGITCMLLIRILIQLRRDENHRLRREQGVFLGMCAAGLKAVDNLQAMSRENDFFSKWSGRQARELRARQSFTELGHVSSALPELVQLIAAAVVFGLGGWRIMTAGLTIGELIGIYILASNFLHPLMRIAQYSDLLSTMGADLSRMDDVLNAPQEAISPTSESNPDQKIMSLDGRLRLIGRLEFRDVAFGFQRNRPRLIENINFVVEPGQRVAIVGRSGSGKSTISLLAAGLYRPLAGQILYDGYSIDSIPQEVFHRSVAIVDQHPVLFATSVRNNLTMWDTTVPDNLVVAAAQDAMIHRDIISRLGTYESKVEEGGRNFSGGQRLRLEIARALVNNPSFVILDEATSSLDAVTEFEIDDRIRQRGCSCLIVAHRLSTIRDSDLILVIDGGRIVEQGTHESLYKDGSMYRGLLDGE